MKAQWDFVDMVWWALPYYFSSLLFGGVIWFVLTTVICAGLERVFK